MKTNEFKCIKPIIVKPQMEKFVKNYPRRISAGNASCANSIVSSRVGGVSYIDENELKFIKSLCTRLKN